MKKKNRRVSKSKEGVRPLGDRVLLKEIKQEGEQITKSGIIIPETVNEDKGSKKGTVIAVGEGRYDDGRKIPMAVSVGDTVLFQWGDMVKIGEEEYYLVSETNILAIIK